MIRKIVQYRVKPDAVEVVRTAITNFVKAIVANEPDTIYGSLVAEDGLTFFHAMAFPDEVAERRHRNAEHTKRFVEVLYPKCDQEPQFTAFQVIGTTKGGGGFLGLDKPGVR